MSSKLSTISNFKTKLGGGGARPNLFEADVVFGDNSFWENGAQDNFHFMCKATSMPTQTIGSVDVPFRGRILKVAGDRTFEPWTVTVINDQSFDIRRSFEKWGEVINDLASGNGEVTPANYMGNGFIHQLSRTEIGTVNVGGSNGNASSNVLYTYEVKDIWPSEIGSIDLSYDSSDAIEEFTVTFQVQYMAIRPKGTGSTGGRDGASSEEREGDPAETQTTGLI